MFRIGRLPKIKTIQFISIGNRITNSFTLQTTVKTEYFSSKYKRLNNFNNNIYAIIKAHAYYAKNPHRIVFIDISLQIILRKKYFMNDYFAKKRKKEKTVEFPVE